MGIVTTKTDDKLVITHNKMGQLAFEFVFSLSVVIGLALTAINIHLHRPLEIRCQRLEEKVVNCTVTPVHLFLLRGEPQAHGRVLGIIQEERVDSEGDRHGVIDFYLRFQSASQFKIQDSQASAIGSFLSSPQEDELLASPSFVSEAARLIGSLVLTLVAGLLMFFAFLILFLDAFFKQYTFDLNRRQLVKTEKRLLGATHQEFSLGEIDLLYHEEEDSDGDWQSRIKVLLPGSKEEEVLSYFNKKAEALKEYQDLRSFLGLPPDRSISAEQTPAEKPD